MTNLPKRDDILKKIYGSKEAVMRAQEVLERDEQSELAFLGAQGVLLLHGLI